MHSLLRYIRCNYTWCYNLSPCYNLDLNSSCNLDKDLKKDRENNQLVKHKNTRLYLQLYIPNDYKK